MTQDNIIPSNRSPYDGENVLAEDSFLRRLPVTLAPEQRMQLEALVFISDALTWGFRTVRQHAAEHAVLEDHWPPASHAEMFAAAWSLVDNLDAARQLIWSMTKERRGPKTGALLEALAPVRVIRNDRDHLSGNISRFTSQKGHRRPVFGAISFFAAKPEEIVRRGDVHFLAKGRSISISAGTLRPNDLVPFAIPEGHQIVAPIDLLRLGAFDHEIELAPIIAQFASFMAHLEGDVERDLRRKVSDHATSTGANFDELFAPPSRDVIFIAEIAFDLPPEEGG